MVDRRDYPAYLGHAGGRYELFRDGDECRRLSFSDCGCNRRMKKIAILLLLLGCAKARPEPQPAAKPNPETALYDDASARMAGFLDRGYVISRNSTGSADAQGDSLIFSGLALYGLPCTEGLPIAGAVEEMILALHGGLWRHPDLPDQISMDGALGLYRGISKRITECDEQARWAELMTLHKEFMEANGDKLNPKADTTLPPQFTVVRDGLFARLGLAGSPSANRQAALEAEIVSWAVATAQTKSACYRINLGLISLETEEENGQTISQTARNTFCSVTNGLSLIEPDFWCGRGAMQAFLDGFSYNKWQYRFQRCPGWESPDAGSDTEPAVDYLVGYKDYTTK